MRKIIIFTTLIACFMFIISSIHSQTTIITDDPAYTTGESSAILDVKSTASGLIIPRLTEKARNDILLPATGLLIFQTDADPGFYFNAGTPAFPDWQRLKDGTSGHWMINGDDIYYLDGNVGIGTDEPDALLHTHGTGDGEGNVLFVGERKATPGEPPASDAGTRMMWYPDKAAFRVGYVSGSNWNMDSIGSCSVAMGFNPKSKGLYSTAIGFETYATGMVSSAFGDKTTASGKASSTMGHYTIASGDYSTAFGYKCDASGYISTALGRNTNASGDYSTAMGYYTNAKSAFETVIGRYNLDYTPNDTTGWNTIDRLFVIGNGVDSTNRSNAMTVLKNGNVGLGTDVPEALFHTYGTGTGEGNVLFVGNYKTSNPGDPPASGEGTRMMWYPDKAAFRVGLVTGTHWDKDSIGNYSMAMGYNTKAKGSYSTAMGYYTNAYASSSTAMGGWTTAYGLSSTAMGSYTTASGSYSTAMGYNTTASASSSTAMGSYTTASGLSSTAMGSYTTASGSYSTAMGSYTTASASSSTAMGSYTTASGSSSTAMGANTIAKSGYETVIGRYNIDYTPFSSPGWNSNDRLFVIGNGVDSDNRSNAMTVLKNGKIGFGTHAPTALLHTYGTGTGEGNVLFVGSYKDVPGNPPATGAGTRMMWFPDKAAFRAGRVTGAQWNNSNIGTYSTATGYNTTASGIVSTAMGDNTTASGASSVSMGVFTSASGDHSTAMGRSTTASGANSTAMGYFTKAHSAYETVVGRNNTDYTPSSTTGWAASDRLFVIGNGYGSKSNAMTVLKNGRTGIGTDSPSAGLHLKGADHPGSFMYLESDAGKDAGFRIYESSTVKWHIFNEYNTQGGGFSIRNNAYSLAFHIRQSDAFVGLGTSSPTQKLHVVGNAYKTEGGTAWATSSDIRLKKILGEYSKGLMDIIALQPVRFKYLPDNPRGIEPGTEQVGFVAQEVKKIFPEAVTEASDGYLDFNIHSINVALVNAIKELKAENDKLKAENAELRENDNRVNVRLEQLEKAMESMALK